MLTVTTSFMLWCGVLCRDVLCAAAGTACLRCCRTLSATCRTWTNWQQMLLSRRSSQRAADCGRGRVLRMGCKCALAATGLFPCNSSSCLAQMLLACSPCWQQRSLLHCDRQVMLNPTTTIMTTTSQLRHHNCRNSLSVCSLQSYAHHSLLMRPCTSAPGCCACEPSSPAIMGSGRLLSSSCAAFC